MLIMVMFLDVLDVHENVYASGALNGREVFAGHSVETLIERSDVFEFS
jgi:hypothetical protein